MQTPEATQTTRLLPALPEHDVILRARAEFLEMPGLQLTDRQAARLLGCQPEVSEAVLAHLMDVRFLTRTRNGAFARA